MDTPAAPALVTIPDVDIVATGTWNLSTGEATFTTDDLAAAVDASSCPAVGPPLIKLGHIDPRFDGEPAVGRVANMTLTASGNKITGDLAGMPGWLGDVLPSAYPNRSIEGTYGFVCQIGHVHPFVITALALLGVASPGVGVLNSLEDIAALYGVAAAAAADPGRTWTLMIRGGAPMAGTVLAQGITTEDVRRAYYENASYEMWITELQLDPLQLIVADEGTSKVYRVPVTTKGGKLTFGDAVEVIVEYVDVPTTTAAAGGMRWASRDESREGITTAGGPPTPLSSAAAALGRLREIRAQVADMDADESVNSMIAALDATLDQASALIPADTSGLEPDVAQALTLIIAAESIADDLMELLGIDDPDDRAASRISAARTPPHEEEHVSGTSAASADHGVCAEATTHSHSHAAMGSQGGDETHTHEHSHPAGTGTHDHTHASAAGDTHAHTGTDRIGASAVDFTEEHTAALRASLGLADDQELTPALIIEALTRRPAAAARGQLPQGVIAVDSEQWDKLNAQVRAGEEFIARQRVKERDMVISAAIADGKFSPARRTHWVRLWDSDPEGTRDVLGGLQKNVVPVSDLGSAGGDEDDLLTDEYKSLFPPGSVRS